MLDSLTIVSPFNNHLTKTHCLYTNNKEFIIYIFYYCIKREIASFTDYAYRRFFKQVFMFVLKECFCPRGPLNFYRNVERNWRWMCSRPRGKASACQFLQLCSSFVPGNCGFNTRLSKTPHSPAPLKTHVASSTAIHFRHCRWPALSIPQHLLLKGLG